MEKFINLWIVYDQGPKKNRERRRKIMDDKKNYGEKI